MTQKQNGFALPAFRNPPATYRPAPFWSWNDKLELVELERQIEEMADKGWGGFFMHARVGLVTPYLSEEWMELVKGCVRKARDTGLQAWLYDEDKWPSGFAGGEVSKHEAYRSRALVLLERDEVTEQDTVLHVYEDGTRQRLICKRISPLGSVWFNGANYTDLMNPEAVQAFIASTHERYAEACGEAFGREILGVFTDEPCYLMEWDYEVPVVPWSDYLPGAFMKWKHYDVLEHLPALFFDVGDFHRVRFDFYDVATRLFVENFTKPYAKWCAEHNLIMTGHYMREESLIWQTQWNGAVMPHYAHMQWPGIDKLRREISSRQLVAVKQLTSVCDQLGKERSLSEAFGVMGHQTTFFDRKWIADWQAALGITFVNHHLSLYSMRGERKRDYPPNFFYQQPWWEEEKALSDYLGRLSYALSTGRRMVDILVIHPVASVWGAYSPLQKEGNYAALNEQIEGPFAQLSELLMQRNLDFHYGDEMIMEEHGRLEEGKLYVGQHAYSIVIVPPITQLRTHTVKLLEAFVRHGRGNVMICVGAAPVRVEGRAVAMAWPKEAIGATHVQEAVELAEQYASRRISTTCVRTGRNLPTVLCHERQLSGNGGNNSGSGSLLFICNTSETEDVDVRVAFDLIVDPETGSQSSIVPVVLDLMSGEQLVAPVVVQDGRCQMELRMYAAGSLLLHVPSCSEQKRSAPAFLESGIAFAKGLLGEMFASSEDTSDFLLGSSEVGEELADMQWSGDWHVQLCEGNVLPLHQVTLEMDGNIVLQDAYVAKAWHEHFYPVAEGTPFRVMYAFDIKTIPSGKLYAVIETAENLDHLSLNGEALQVLRKSGDSFRFDESQCWKDVSFTKVDITGLVRHGINQLVLEGRKRNNISGVGAHTAVSDCEQYEPTEVESIYIVGDFLVHDQVTRPFAPNGASASQLYYIDGSMEERELEARNLSISGLPFYAGNVNFHTRIALKGIQEPVCTDREHPKSYLFIEDVEAAYLNMRVNGINVGSCYWNPWVFDVTHAVREGWNDIAVMAAPSSFNLLGPHRIEGIEEEIGIGPRTFVDETRYTEQYTLMPFGIGKLRVVVYG